MGLLAFGKDKKAYGVTSNKTGAITDFGDLKRGGTFNPRQFAGMTEEQVRKKSGGLAGVYLGSSGKSGKSGGPTPKKKSQSTAQTTANAGSTRSKRSILAGSTNTGGGASLLGRSK